MGSHYLPRADAELLAWARAFVAYASEHAAELGVSAEDVALVADLVDAFCQLLTANHAAQQAAHGARQAKDDGREAMVRALRALVRRIQAAPSATDLHRAGLGITRADRTPTEAPRPVSRPMAVVDTSQRLQHAIRFFDEATPTRKARPHGVMGCEIWVKVGDGPPAEESELTFLAMDTASPYVAEYEGADAGKKAYYMLRWVSTRGQKGPWSAIAEATIVG